MKKTPPAITHESFPAFVDKMEQDSPRLSGQKLGRTLASILNVLFAAVLVLLTVCILYNSEDPATMEPATALSHIPDFFRNAGDWALGLFPEGFSFWLAMPILLVAIPVTGVISGLAFRFIPFRGKKLTAEPADTLTARVDNAIAYAQLLHKRYNLVTDYYTGYIIVSAVAAGVAVLALPIVSVCRATAGEEWYIVLASVVEMLIGMLFLLLVVLCVLCFVTFWLAVAQEWVTSLFYRGHDFKTEEALLKDYRALLDKEAQNAHAAEIAAVEAQAIAQMIAGKCDAARGTLTLVESEALDARVIREVADTLEQAQENVDGWIAWLKWSAEEIHSETLRAFVTERQTACRRELMACAEAEYPTALEQLAGGDYAAAADRLRAADAVDYRDGAALYTLAEYCAGRTVLHSVVIERLTRGLEKGMEERFALLCRQAISRAEEALEERRRERARLAREEEERQQAIGAYIIDHFTCEYLVNGQCCRYCTIDNFPPPCYYVGRSRDQYMCSKRK